MKIKITPEYVLNMLQELKKLTDDRRFSPAQFCKKYPTYSVFRIYIFSKGLMKKEFGNNKWISIEPNIIMARELLKLYNEYVTIRMSKLKKVKPKEKVYTKKTAMSLAKEIRKEGEGWKDAIIRASKIMKNGNLEVLKNLEEKINSNKPFIRERKTKSKPIVKSSFIELAKEIRKEGEKWNDAISRASKIIKGESSKGIQTRPLTMEEMFPMAYEQDRILNGTDSNSIIKKLKDESENTIKELNKFRKDFDELINDYNSLGEEAQEVINILKLKNQELNNQINRNKSLISTLQEKNEKKNDEIGDLKNKLKFYEAKEIMSLPEPSLPKPSLPEPFFEYPSMPEPPIFERELTSQEKMGTYKGSKTYKLFGIPVFSINNK